jgi:hypothetical protein
MTFGNMTIRLTQPETWCSPQWSAKQTREDQIAWSGLPR